MTQLAAGIVLAILAAIPMLSSFSPAPHADAREDARLRAHFTRVLHTLTRADVTHLTPAQRCARAGHLRELREYARGGAFPRNRGEASGRTPIFVDPSGNRCAMAHLIERSGRDDLVSRVARTANLACIYDLASDPDLIEWLEEAGLTVAEAAAIQPAYDGYTTRQEDEVPTEGVMVASALLAIGMCGPAIALNLGHEGRSWEARKAHIVLGTLAGGAAAAAGIVDWSSDSRLRGPGYFALTLGVTTLALSQMNLWSGRGEHGAASENAGETTASVAPAPGRGLSWQAGPRIGMDGDPQFAVRLGF
jgi:hypothetical protein